ncbi:hypothetical protein ACYULU_03275 [Breznakiellaceae bacterium SP9]
MAICGRLVGKSGKEKGSKLKLLVGLPVNIDTAKFVSALKETGVERIEINRRKIWNVTPLYLPSHTPSPIVRFVVRYTKLEVLYAYATDH